MSFDWPITTLVEFAEINPKRAIPKGTVAPFVDMASLPAHARDIPVADVAERVFTGGGAKFANGDTLLARITPCLENGKTALVSCLPDGVNGHGSTEFIVLSPRIDSDQYFLYYLTRSDEFRTYAISRMEGTSGRQRVPNNSVGQYSFSCPPKSERRAIGEILATLDDRIALLRETNITLEALAQALFKSWFVDFDPVRAKQESREPEGMDSATAALFPDSFAESELGLVPRGWRVHTLADSFEINPTRKLSKGSIAPYLDMASLATSGHCVETPIQREMGSGSKFRNGDTLLARITPCLENGKSAFVDFLADDQIGWGSTEFLVLRPKEPLPEYFGYLLCRHPLFREYAIQSMSGTSGRQRIQNDALGRYALALPDSKVALAFSGVVESIQESISTNHETAQTLAALRDTLLPHLISGQLRLPEAQTMLMKVAA
jgi:type I restriction enzyme S subunit